MVNKKQVSAGPLIHWTFDKGSHVYKKCLNLVSISEENRYRGRNRPFFFRKKEFFKKRKLIVSLTDVFV